MRKPKPKNIFLAAFKISTACSYGPHSHVSALQTTKFLDQIHSGLSNGFFRKLQSVILISLLIFKRYEIVLQQEIIEYLIVNNNERCLQQ